jgi:DNA polymerase III sliding clamp (beta) subunit (PCNA family)
MKVTVERAQLLKSLGHVHRVVERRNTIPILGNVLVRAEGAKLSLKATDLDLEVTETLAAETGTGGSTTVPAHMFYDIVRKSAMRPTATVRCWRSGPAARASPCRRCPKATFPILPPAT